MEFGPMASDALTGLGGDPWRSPRAAREQLVWWAFRDRKVGSGLHRGREAMKTLPARTGSVSLSHVGVHELCPLQ